MFEEGGKTKNLRSLVVQVWFGSLSSVQRVSRSILGLAHSEREGSGGEEGGGDLSGSTVQHCTAACTPAPTVTSLAYS